MRPYIPRCKNGHKLSGNNVYLCKKNIKCRKCDPPRLSHTLLKTIDNKPRLSESELSVLSRAERRMNTRLLYSHGITLEDYNKLFQRQKGCCAICHRHQSKLKRGLFVDHDHKTDIVRGLLCQKCNSALGLFRDKIKYLRRGLRYLEQA